MLILIDSLFRLNSPPYHIYTPGVCFVPYICRKQTGGQQQPEKDEAVPAPTPDVPDDEYVPDEDSSIPDEEYSFIYHGCVFDSKAERIMTRMELSPEDEKGMTAEVCVA